MVRGTEVGQWDISIFLVAPDYPQYQIAILMVAVVCLIQFAPSYATLGYNPSKANSLNSSNKPNE